MFFVKTVKLLLLLSTTVYEEEECKHMTSTSDITGAERIYTSDLSGFLHLVLCCKIWLTRFIKQSGPVDIRNICYVAVIMLEHGLDLTGLTPSLSLCPHPPAQSLSVCLIASAFPENQDYPHSRTSFCCIIAFYPNIFVEKLFWSS